VPAAVLAAERELSQLSLKGMLDATEFAKRIAATFKCCAAFAGFCDSVAQALSAAQPPAREGC
jgi:hypothetical protein